MKNETISNRILWNLDYNARIPLATLSKKVGISKQNLNYHLKKLTKEGTIKKFASVIDLHKLGYLTYRIYLRYKNVTENKEKEITNHFKNHNHVVWFVSLIGSWDLEVVIGARNFIHFNNLFKKIKEDIGENFSRYEVSMSVVNYHFKRDYLLGKKRKDFALSYYGFEPETIKIDMLDLKILNELSKDCSQSNMKIGEKLKTTYQTIKQRIKKLEEKKIIQNHRILFDIKKINREYHKILLKLNNPSKKEEKALYEFCSQYNFVVYLVEVLGSIQMEIESEVKSREEIINLLKEIKNKFPNLIEDYYTLEVTKEHKLNYFPMAEELLKHNKDKETTY